MHILMTGATGLIGKETGKRLVKEGHQLTVLVRDTESARRSLPFPAKFIKWNSNERLSPEVFEGIEGIVHLAGESVAGGRWTEERKRLIRDSRIQGTRSLVEGVLQSKTNLQVFVLGSAVGYYGESGDTPLDESSKIGEGFLAEVVRDWEAEVQALVDKGVRVPIIRTGVVFDRHGGALLKLLPLFEKGVAGHLGHGQQWMSWIHLADISRLFTFAVDNHQANGVINGVAPEPVRNDRFTIELARALGKPVFLPVPETALKIVLGEMSSSVLGSQRVLPKRAQELGFKFEHGEIVEALQTLAAPLKGGQREIFSEQWLPVKPEEVFPFYCDEKNLEELTPPFLRFKVLGKSTDKIGEGTLIDYRLSLHGIPFKWRTRIEDWQPKKRFVDTQLSGPYQKWYHVHDFEEFAGGTLVRDRVTYKLPLGIFGDTLAGWKVSRDVEKIFAYRRQIIDGHFGRPEGGVR